MKSLLIITEDQIESDIKNHLKNEFNLYFARGPITIETKLKTNNIQAIIWLNPSNNKKLFPDICQVINRFKIKVYFLAKEELLEAEKNLLEVDYSILANIQEFSEVTQPEAKQTDKLNDEEEKPDELAFRYLLRSSNKQKKLKLDKVKAKHNNFEHEKLTSAERGALSANLPAPQKQKSGFWNRLFKK